jgi:hypothetical protein
MRKRDKFEDAPKGEVTIIDDFLPPPSQLAREGEDTIEITVEYTRLSIELLIEEAEEAHVSYQYLLRALVDEHAEQYAQKS